MTLNTAARTRTHAWPAAAGAQAGRWLRRLVALGHNSLALVGLGLLAATFALGMNLGWQERLATGLLETLQLRQVARLEAAAPAPRGEGPDEALNRVTATHPSELSSPQAAVAQSLSRRYRVSLEPIGRLVQEAWELGERLSLDPTLILAVAAVESGFNPFAQGAQGSQGLMQVRTVEHDAKFLPFGGRRAAFDPISNLRVGVLVLKECIERAGSLEQGLRLYGSGADAALDNSPELAYTARVLTEQLQLLRVSLGRAAAPKAAVASASLATPAASPVSSPKTLPAAAVASAERAEREPRVALARSATTPGEAVAALVAWQGPVN